MAAGGASFFRSVSGEGLSELVMEFPAVLRVFLIDVMNRGSRFAAISNRHRFATISNCTIRAARPKTNRIAVKVLLFSLLLR